MPATAAITPAEASTEVPTVRMPGNCISMIAAATTPIAADTARRISATWVRTRRTRAASCETAAYRA